MPLSNCTIALGGMGSYPTGNEGNGTQSDSGLPPEFTILITPTSKIKAKVTRKGVITLARLGSYGRPSG